MSWLWQRASEAGGRMIAPGVSPGIIAHFLVEPAKRATDISSVRPRAANVQRVFCRPFGAQDFFHAVYPGLTPGATFCRRLRRLVVAFVLTTFFCQLSMVHAQTTPSPTSIGDASIHTRVLSRYLDQTTGMTANEAVAYALTHNAELEATRKEIDAA